MPEDPPRRRRPAWMTVVALLAWTVAAHAVLVPGVAAYALIMLGREEGWADVLATGPAQSMVLLFGLSTASTVAFALSGRSFWLDRARRGWWESGAGAALAVLSTMNLAWIVWNSLGYYGVGG